MREHEEVTWLQSTGSGGADRTHLTGFKHNVDIPPPPSSSLLVGAIQTAGMTELLNQQGALTFFAPTNAAFNALAKPDLNRLMREYDTEDRVENHQTLHTHVPAARLAPSLVRTLGLILFM